MTLIKNLDDKIVELIQEQLSEGKRGDNTLLPQYSKSSLFEREKLGKMIAPNGRIVLYDTGAFWNAMFANSGDDDIEVDSKDYKRDMLIKRYGENIFLLSQNSIEDLIYPIFDDIKREVNAHLIS